MNACFTGHRPNKLQGGYDYYSEPNIELGRMIRSECIKAYEKGVRHFICGGAIGIDQMAFMVCHKMKRQGYDITIELAAPFKNQDVKWMSESKKIHNDHLKKADIVTYVDLLDDYRIIGVKEDIYFPLKMQKRNEYMVDKADIVIAVWDGTPGGTRNCVNYAKENNKEIVVIQQ